MTRSLASRLDPLTGVAFVLLLLVALILEGTPPSADAATEEVVQYYADKETRLLAGTVAAGLAAALLVWFGAGTYTTLRAEVGASGRAATVAFGGFIVAAVGLTMLFGFVLAAAETVDDVPYTAVGAWVVATLVWVPVMSVVIFFRTASGRALPG